MPIFRSARPYITAYGFSVLNVLAGVLGSRDAGRVHCVEAVIRLQPAHQVLKTICSNIRPCAPEDGHNGVRNMLS